MDTMSSGPAPSSNELAATRTKLADSRTHLAVTRTMVALDRTLMAWVRTSTSLISFGFTIYKFFQYLRQGEKTNVEHLLSPREVGLVMISLGVVALFMATLDYRNQMQKMRADYRDYGPFHVSIAGTLAALMCGLGVIGFVLVFLRQ